MLAPSHPVQRRPRCATCYASRWLRSGQWWRSSSFSLNRRRRSPLWSRSMAAAFAFLGMLLLSMVVALLATLQLGDFFNANDEFGLVILTVVAFTFFALAVFAVTYALSRSASVIAGVALILAIVALAPVALPGLIQKIANRSTNPYTVGIENTAILIELVVPALIVV